MCSIHPLNPCIMNVIKFPCRECTNDVLLPIPGHDLAECSECGYPNDMPSDEAQDRYLDGLAKGHDVSGNEIDEEMTLGQFKQDIDRMANAHYPVHLDDEPVEGDYPPDVNPEC